MTPTALDIVVFTILILSTVFAAWRGFIRELLTILGLVVAVYATYKGGHMLVPFFNDLLHVSADGGTVAAETVSTAAHAEPTTKAGVQAFQSKSHLILGLISPALLAKGLAYGGTFMAVLMIMSLFSYFLSRTVQEMGLGFVDRGIGAGFGFLRGFLFIFLPYVVFFILVGKNVEKFPAWARNSVSVPILNDIYTDLDHRFDISKKIQDKGDAIVVQFDKTKEDSGTAGKVLDSIGTGLKKSTDIITGQTPPPDDLAPDEKKQDIPTYE